MEKFDLENFPTSESAKKMLSYVSDGFYDESYVGKWLFQVMGAEYDKALEIVEDLPAQFFPETATWGLMYHEIKWGLPVRQNLPYEERRRLIFQKRDCRAPMTPYRMERYLEDATGFDVFVADCHDSGPYGYVPPHPNVFKVFFVGSETLDAKNVCKIINRLKQSHTIYELNDRMELVINESGIEEIRLVNVKHHLTICFWYCRMFDGSWLLNGSARMDAQRRYGLVLGLECGLGGIAGCGETKLVSAIFLTEVNEEERGRAEVRYQCGFYSLLSSVRWDGMGIGIKYSMEMIGRWQDEEHYSVFMKWKQRISESMDAVIAAGLRGKLFAEWSSKACLAVRLDLDLSGQEKVDHLAVETRTKDYWFFDGTVNFDGLKKFNSIYEREVML